MTANAPISKSRPTYPFSLTPRFSEVMTISNTPLQRGDDVRVTPASAG